MSRPFALATTVVLLGLPPAAHAQSPATLEAFDRYVQRTDARVQADLSNPATFLWIDSLPAARRTQALAAVRRGEVAIERLRTTDAGVPIEIPHGLVHHWVGVVFVPGATRASAVRLLQDYDRHGEVYAPAISQGRLIARNGDEFTFTMRFVVRKIITAVLQTDQTARFFHPAPDRTYSRIVSTRIVELENAGTPTEREKPPGRDRGYLWRMASYWRFLERDGGVYVECESMSLSRDLPRGLGWIFGRAVTGVPRDTLTHTLERTRKELE